MKRRMICRVFPYYSAVGSFMYAMICTRPNIAHVVGSVSRFLSNPEKEHWGAVKWILRYLKGMSNMELYFGRGKSELVCYTGFDWEEILTIQNPLLAI